MALRQVRHRTRRITTPVCAAAALAGVLGAAPPSRALPDRDGGVLLVRPGESVQRAVDAARPGDTVFLAPGVYRESVRIDKSHLMLRGSGRRTVLAPPATRAENACGQHGDGICVTAGAGGPLTDVHLRSLTVEGFRRNGVWASGTEGLTVHRVRARHNGQWGIGLEKSVRSSVRDSDITDNGDAGVFVANVVEEEGGALDTRGTLLVRNTLAGNRIGVTARRVRNLLIGHNTVTGNCAGVFVVGDEGRPRAGALTVRDNEVARNNKFCPKTKRLPFLQGVGVVLTGTEDSLVQHNLVRDNTGTSPLSGGVVLFHSFVKATNDRNLVRDNIVLRNAPADLINADPDGRGNVFIRNTCRTSRPPGLCGDRAPQHRTPDHAKPPRNGRIEAE
ncbi:right-handed parallel beta-helix repeat-containing protein [Streptomyces sp. NRRL F-4489]|uniref:right-handed parallel beta-helix repeat-containing protein n=1 Tax=Streptomyces sp. NRRL F-4489 TaxID=1609095 RepID=UPI00099E40C2|nr:right-handed parallel beta-helix repeat-containing protein [Streptomyces sp. NRRL F-4489]